jgi:2-dehydro-3-deoxyphosphogluconate aldolase / (4S)-4-hydroxy-2-oxoglutarate aldolase
MILLLNKKHLNKEVRKVKKSEVLRNIMKKKLVAVIRAENSEKAKKIIEACIKGGISIIEVTFTVPDAVNIISKLIQKYQENDILIGVGTVTNANQAQEAILAGAAFVVGPGLDEEVLEVCEKNQIAYMPGCMTITEMMKVTKLGCEIVKLFPGSVFGPEFIKAVKGPLPDILIMPTGGVDLDNVKTWLDCGAVALGIGSKLTAPAKRDDYERIQALAQEFVQKVKEASL